MIKLNKVLVIIGLCSMGALAGCSSGSEVPEQELSEDSTIEDNVDVHENENQKVYTEENQELYEDTFIEGFNYNEFLRYDDYIGTKVKIVLDTTQIVDDTTYYCMDLNSQRYVISDKRRDKSKKVLEGDVIAVYGEYIGAESYEMLSGLKEDIFTVDAEIIELYEGFKSAKAYYEEMDRQAQEAKFKQWEEQENTRRSTLIKYEDKELSDYIDYSAEEIIPTFNMEDRDKAVYGIFRCNMDSAYGKYLYRSSKVDFVLDDKEVKSIILDCNKHDILADNSIYDLRIDDLNISKWSTYTLLKETVEEEEIPKGNGKASTVYRTYGIDNKYLLVKVRYFEDSDGDSDTMILKIILTKDNPKKFNEKEGQYFDIDKDKDTNMQSNATDKKDDAKLKTAGQGETKFDESKDMTNQPHLLVMNSSVNNIIDASEINSDDTITQRTLPDWIEAKNVAESNSTEEFVYPDVTYMQISKSVEVVNHIISNFISNEREQSNDAESSSVDYEFILGDSIETDSRYIGLGLHGYRYYSGTAHGMGSNAYYMITPERGILDINDIGGLQFKEEINNSVRNILKDRVLNEGLKLYDDPENITVKFNGDWILTSNGIHVIFEQDEIAPHFEGDIEITVPYDEVAGYLNNYGKTLIGAN